MSRASSDVLAAVLVRVPGLPDDDAEMRLGHEPSQALKLTLYFNEALRSDGRLAADRLLELFEDAEVRVSVLLRGIGGFGAHHRLHTDRFENASLNQPVVAVAVDEAARIEALVERVDAVLPSGLVTTERAVLVHEASAPLPPVAHDAVKLTVYLGRAERHAGRPSLHALVAHLRASGVDGATAFLGVDGTMHGRRRRAAFFSRNRDVPLMIVSVGSPESVARALPGVHRIAENAIATLEGVQICKRDGALLGAPAPLASAASEPAWAKLMVHAAGDAHVGGDSLHYQLVERLRRLGASGATTLRGVWGYRGAREPHGDSVRSLRRTSPVATILVERPERLAPAWEAIDALTRGTGLVTSELVPAHRALGAAAGTVSAGDRRG